MSIQGKLRQIEERAAAGQILEMDLEEFIKDPLLWRKQAQKGMILTPEEAQAFWQGVWDEILGPGKVAVPPIGLITDKQRKSLTRFELLLVYLVPEELYPACFVRPDPEQLGDSKMQLMRGCWVAVETTSQYNYHNPRTFDEDALMVAAGGALRRRGVTSFRRNFISWLDLYGKLLGNIAKTTGYPLRNTRLPYLLERCLIASLFIWLNEHRNMSLPNLDCSLVWEWCGDTAREGIRFLAGEMPDLSISGGLRSVDATEENDSGEDIVFRVLFEI